MVLMQQGKVNFIIAILGATDFGTKTVIMKLPSFKGLCGVKEPQNQNS